MVRWRLVAVVDGIVYVDVIAVAAVATPAAIIMGRTKQYSRRRQRSRPGELELVLMILLMLLLLLLLLLSRSPRPVI